MAVSADGSKLAAGGFDGNVWVWETGRDEPTRTPMHRGIVHTLAFAPDGRSLVSGGHDGTVRFLDLELMQERFNVSSGSEARALVFSPDGSAWRLPETTVASVCSARRVRLVSSKIAGGAGQQRRRTRPRDGTWWPRCGRSTSIGRGPRTVPVPGAPWKRRRRSQKPLATGQTRGRG